MNRLEPPPPAPVLELAADLERAGYEAWCVGGAVRDALLGHRHLDWDLATSATPAQVRKVFRRTIPVGEEFGTIGVLDRDGRMHEVTTFRRDVQTDGRHAVVQFGASLDEDLARRDFTINAIAYSPASGELRDPFGGREDLERRILRAVGDPEQRMREDRLRALRGIRFAARFGFEFDPPTWAAIRASAPHLTRLSPERVRQELEKTMQQVRRPGMAIGLWRDSGALAVVIPDLASLSDRTLAALDLLPPPAERSGAGNPAVVDGVAARRTMARLALVFLELDPKAAERTLRALRFSNATSTWIATLAQRWHTLGDDMQVALDSASEPTDSQIRRWVAIAGRTRIAPLLRLGAALWSVNEATSSPRESPRSLATDARSRRIRSLYRRALRSAYRDAIEIADLAIDGEDLAGIGIAGGPLVGKILRVLLEDVIAEPSRNTREALLQRAGALRDASLS